MGKRELEAKTIELEKWERGHSMRNKLSLQENFFLKTDNIIGCSGSGRSSDSRESLLDDGDKQNSVGFSIAPEKP